MQLPSLIRHLLPAPDPTVQILADRIDIAYVRLNVLMIEQITLQRQKNALDDENQTMHFELLKQANEIAHLRLENEALRRENQQLHGQIPDYV